jgi:2-C-methyl-D-erythritol 2,4-cyclodiphosphate synthase
VRVGLGYDIHPFGEATLVLGGVTIDGPGLVGHSDGDAVAHAVADALLGPSGLGDLGSLFSNSDERWRDADSMDLLGDVVGRVREQGWEVSNVDVVIAAEEPELGAHLDAMRANILAVLAPIGRDLDVSIKPKRGEGIGAVGRVEGIAVWAVALLMRA